MRKKVLFLFFSLLLASAAVLYTLHSITPLPIARPVPENGSVAVSRTGQTYNASISLPRP